MRYRSQNDEPGDADGETEGSSQFTQLRPQERRARGERDEARGAKGRRGGRRDLEGEAGQGRRRGRQENGPREQIGGNTDAFPEL